MKYLSYYEFSTKSPAAQEECFRDWIEKTDFTNGALLKGHSERHCGSTDEEMVKRVLIDGVSDSTFPTEAEEKLNAQEMLFFYTKHIINWLTKSRNEFDNVQDYRTLVLDGTLVNYDNDDEPFYTGVDKDLNKIFTPMCRIVMERNLDVYSQDGRFFCYIKTCFPLLEHDSAIKKGNLIEKAKEILDEDLKKDVKKREISNIKHALWGFKFEGIKAFERKDYKRGDCLVVPFVVNGYRFSVEFDANSLNYTKPFLTVKVKKNGQTKYVKPVKSCFKDEKILQDAETYAEHLKLKYISYVTGVEYKIKNIKSPINEIENTTKKYFENTEKGTSIKIETKQKYSKINNEQNGVEI